MMYYYVCSNVYTKCVCRDWTQASREERMTCTQCTTSRGDRGVGLLIRSTDPVEMSTEMCMAMPWRNSSRQISKSQFSLHNTVYVHVNIRLCVYTLAVCIYMYMYMQALYIVDVMGCLVGIRERL